MSTELQQVYDLIVIGAGAAGSTAAFEAQALGARVAMVEQWRVGGTCLNVGCDPTKALVHAAGVLHEARTAARLGLTIPQATADWPAVVARVQEVIDTIRGGDGDRNFRDAGIALYKEHGRLVAPDTVAAGGELLRGRAILLATGVRAHIPAIPGLAAAGFITNIEAVELPRLPRSLAIIGVGVIALEFAQIFARFGVQVTLLGRNARFLPEEEPELADALRQHLSAEGIRIETGVDLHQVSTDSHGKHLVGQQGGRSISVTAEEILVASGRRPRLDDLGLADVGVMANADGVIVDEALRTTVPGIWAAGDCVAGAPRFTPVADVHARVVVKQVLGEAPPRQSFNGLIPTVIFTDPELGRVGLTAAQALRAGHSVRTAHVPMRDLARAVITGKTAGAVKLVAEAASGRLLGGSVLAPGGGELLGEIALALRLGLPAGVICDTMHAYPTYSESVFWTAWELGKPQEIGLEALRGVSAVGDGG